ncbi:MAG TPA: transcriptional regulator GcvA [Gammaproteobacteria bacterium]|nr:transcriptional regulator GcvA [Gammaproteobacteria bacterium]
MRRLPPLNAVRAFEAAARHLNFNQAARELNVTASAISHQVKTLEDYFGVKLFNRLPRNVSLTPEGRDYLPAVSAALDQLDAASRRLASHTADAPLNLGCAPTFAMGWLIPHLSDFHDEHPEIDVRLTLTPITRQIDFSASDTDVVIMYGTPGAWPNLVTHQLMSEELVPVCSPSLLQEHPLETPSDLRNVTLLHSIPRMGQWRNWLHIAGVKGVDSKRGLRFQTTPLAVSAAVAGAGVAIANRRFVEAELQAGRLVVPFDIDLPSDSGYFLIYPKESGDDPRISAFRSWLLGCLAEEMPEHGDPILEDVPLPGP